MEDKKTGQPQMFSSGWYDFTPNVRAHGLKNFQVGEALKEDFTREGNQFLYQARAAENRFFKESAEKEAIVHYIYVVQPFDPNTKTAT
jgi:hypothetical protein